MRRRFFALGYVFFALLTITGIIMTVSFVERLTNTNIVESRDLIDRALSDSAAIAADQAYIVENVNKDLNASLDNFHFYPDIRFIEKENRSACLACHTPLPHNKDIKTRAFLNMHGGFIACQTCHNDGSKGTYTWYDVARENKVSVLLPEVDLMAIQLVKTVNGEPQYKAFNDPGFQQELAKVKTDPHAMDKLCGQEFRMDPTKALTCERCHGNEDQVMDWSTLGYDEARATELSTLSIPNVFQKYDNFYIPSL